MLTLLNCFSSVRWGGKNLPIRIFTRVPHNSFLLETGLREMEVLGDRNRKGTLHELITFPLIWEEWNKTEPFEITWGKRANQSPQAVSTGIWRKRDLQLNINAEKHSDWGVQLGDFLPTDLFSQIRYFFPSVENTNTSITVTLRLWLKSQNIRKKFKAKTQTPLVIHLCLH